MGDILLDLFLSFLEPQLCQFPSVGCGTLGGGSLTPQRLWGVGRSNFHNSTKALFIFLNYVGMCTDGVDMMWGEPVGQLAG